jgi:hypothetical protein
MVSQIIEIIGHMVEWILSKMIIFKIYIDFFLLAVL